MFHFRTGLAVRACPLRSVCKVKEAPADSLRRSLQEVQIFTFLTIFCGFYRCFTRKTAHRKNLSCECGFLLFQRNVNFLKNLFYDMGHPVRCLNCGREIPSGRPDKKFCSTDCKNRYQNIAPINKRKLPGPLDKKIA